MRKESKDKNETPRTSEFVHRVRSFPGRLAPRLPSLDIELTERCNNNCIHCNINLPEDDEQARNRELTTDQIKEILNQAATLGCLKVRFTGGEPLLRPDFEELYLFARRLGMKVLLFTNGRLITPRLADLFARIPPLVVIEITVYGMRAESYEAVTRAPGSFRDFRRGVALLLERNVPFVVKSARLPPNLAEIDEFEEWAKSIPWMTRPPSYAMFLDLRGRRDDEAKNRRISALRTTPDEGLAIMTRNPERYRREIEEFAGKFMGPAGDRLFGCGAGHEVIIDAYGRAQPCMVLRSPEFTIELFPDGASPEPGGRRTARRLSEVLDLYGRLRDIRASNPDYLRRCAVCFLKGLCEQCPGKSWTEHGTLDTPVEYLCEAAHAQARWMGWLDESERSWEMTDWRDRVRRMKKDR
jgi:MoaA/NifB/PqqE/SkfB family radical SAM enzyme